MKPLFLLSLPRSGSTLVQRVLASHGDVETVSEPWLLLPLLRAREPEAETFADYEHRAAARALSDFLDHFPKGEGQWEDEVRRLAMRLYRGVSGETTEYFVDKTPRYHLVAEQLPRVFPEAELIFLWRNPLAVAASMIETWGNGRWRLYRSRLDLYRGLEGLVEAHRRWEGRAVSVRYEDLVRGEGWDELFGALGLEFDPDYLREFGRIELEGRMGDPKQGGKDAALRTGSLGEWKETLANPVRKSWARRYLRWIGPSRLEWMGYESEELLAQLNSTPTVPRYMISDVARIILGELRIWLEWTLSSRKLGQLPDGRRVVEHR